MSDESIDRLFSEFNELFSDDKFTMTQKYQSGIFTIKIFSRKNDVNFPISYILNNSLEILRQKYGVIFSWSPFYRQIVKLNNDIVSHELCAKSSSEIEFYRKLNSSEI